MGCGLNVLLSHLPKLALGTMVTLPQFSVLFHLHAVVTKCPRLNHVFTHLTHPLYDNTLMNPVLMMHVYVC